MLIETAFKEWAVICRALLEGRQSILLRKGGIAEPTGDFRLEATRFLLFPTFLHQDEHGVRDADDLLDAVRRDRPEEGTIRLEAWADVTAVYQVHDFLPVQRLAHLHAWSNRAVEKRFHYRTPGLQVLALRVHRLARPVEIADVPEYLGCKSWVPLREAVDVSDSTPVLSDVQHQAVITQLALSCVRTHLSPSPGESA